MADRPRPLEEEQGEAAPDLQARARARLARRPPTQTRPVDAVAATSRVSLGHHGAAQKGRRRPLRTRRHASEDTGDRAPQDTPRARRALPM